MPPALAMLPINWRIPIQPPLQNIIVPNQLRLKQGNKMAIKSLENCTIETLQPNDTNVPILDSDSTIMTYLFDF